ncbi:bacterial flagellin [Desulfitobacterium hafniense DP7]|uniref:Flagellin n=1 Tax=Desulfitobacterium hafniense DP7 TaxID=537010 RepID=G9XUM9_DESHA|nr:flagellin [Desulfitobacterium hafniense]EHL04601.1 bacterial flagellin [Desulfitobacterium hafniense DP7]
MIIYNNIPGLNASNALSKNIHKASTPLARASSGLRINHAADDAAGLSINEKMRGQIRGLMQAARNIQDGLSYLDTADGYLGGINSPPLQRLRELAIQAANDTLTTQDREIIQKEVLQIQEHLERLFRTAEFNTHKIFAQDIKRTKTPTPGILPGDTLIRQYGLQVTAGRNDRLTFRLDDQPLEIHLDPGNYTSEQLVHALNEKFKGAGTDVTVGFEGDSLVYHSPTKVLDSFGGSMIEIDSPASYTSIIYDNSKPGYISGAYFLGAEYLSGDVTIDSSNNILTFRVGNSGTYTNVSLTLADGTYSAQGLVDALNHHFNTNGIDVTATKDAFDRLKLQHNKCGAGYTLDQLGGTAKQVILDRLVSNHYSEYIHPGTNGSPAVFTGYRSLTGSVTIEAGRNDALRLNVGGAVHTLTLAAGTYDQAGIITQLNQVFANQSLQVEAKLSGDRLRLEYTGTGTGSLGTVSGGAAYTLMGEPVSGPSLIPGSWQLVEGNTTPIAVGKARATGQTNLANGVQIIAGYNDTLTFELDGQAKSIVLGAQWYSAAELLAEINTKLSGMDVTARYVGPSSRQLVFEHKKEGGGIPEFPYSLKNFGGNALSTLMTTNMPMGQSSGTTPSASYIRGTANISNVTISAGVNDSLTVSVNDNPYSMTLDAGIYTTAQLVTQINDKLGAAGLSSMIEATSYSSYLELRSQTTGTTTQINSVSGNSVNTLFRRVDQYYQNASYIPPSASDTYVDGRVDLRQRITIGTGLNDKLAFDLHDDGTIERKTITLDAGEYTENSLIDMINAKLQAQNLQVAAAIKSINTPQGPKTVMTLTYSPGKNGYFAIDGVGGSASYTVFYPGPYDITYAGGMDLKLQVGANSGNMVSTGTQYMMNTEILGIRRLDYTTRIGADRAIDTVDDAMAMVSAARGLNGAKRNALESLYHNVTQSAENLQAAESRIRDADLAKEMLAHVKQSLLSQASEAVLVQAKQQPQMILELLK